MASSQDTFIEVASPLKLEAYVEINSGTHKLQISFKCDDATKPTKKS